MSTRELAEEDFACRFVEIEDALRGYIVSQIANLTDADDIVQEVSVVLWKKFDDYRPEKSFMHWAFGIARYKILHHKRSFQRSRVLFDDDLAERFALRYESLLPRMVPRRNALKSCLHKLADRARRIVLMKYGEGLRSKVIGTQENLSVSNIDTILSRSREFLHTCIDKTQKKNEIHRELSQV